MVNQQNNTKGLIDAISNELVDSQAWVAIRIDNKGNTHLHMPNSDHMVALFSFLAGAPDIRKAVNEFANNHNKKRR